MNLRDTFTTTTLDKGKLHLMSIVKVGISVTPARNNPEVKHLYNVAMQRPA